MKKLLLHVCCGPCSTIAIERLIPKYKVTLFFSNSNIYPEEEYKKRLETAKKVAELYKIDIIEDKYDQKEWFKTVKGYEKEPEHGKRCNICIKYRLEKTARFAKSNNFKIFATTLTTGPQKNAILINEIGGLTSRKFNIEYFESNFKKKDGFKRSVEISKVHDFYRQNYCGCKYSIKK
ncbi:MAG: epoxyqueuosine reductase QueH [Candidatus Helarchaeota archaeon]